MPPFEPKTYSRALGIHDEKDYGLRGLASDISLSSGKWLLVDNAQRPGYENGSQLYKNDFFIGNILYDLRKAGKIIIPEGGSYLEVFDVLQGEAEETILEDYRHISYLSRFAISFDEVSNFVIPETARRLKVKEEQVGIPNRLEFYALGNLYYKQQFLREPGNPDKWTYEWLEDKVGTDHHYLGGAFNHTVATRSDKRSDRVGFHLVVRFPSKI